MLNTLTQTEREDAASQAQDVLDDYRRAKEALIENGLSPITEIASELLRMERSIFLFTLPEDCLVPDVRITAQKIVDALEDDSPEGAGEAIDEHFSGYLEQARRLAGGGL